MKLAASTEEICSRMVPACGRVSDGNVVSALTVWSRFPVENFLRTDSNADMIEDDDKAIKPEIGTAAPAAASEDNIELVMALARANGAFQRFARLHPETETRFRRLIEDGEPNLNRLVERIVQRVEIDSRKEATRWQAVFGLTRAEIALAEALVAGRTLQEFADETDRKYSTVKTQLLSIFRKTDTSRQAELVTLLRGR